MKKLFSKFRYIKDSWKLMRDKSIPPSQWGFFKNFGLFFYRRREVEWQLAFRQGYAVGKDDFSNDYILWHSWHYVDDELGLSDNHEEFAYFGNENSAYLEAATLNLDERHRVEKFQKELDLMNRPFYQKYPTYPFFRSFQFLKLSIEWMTVHWKGVFAFIVIMFIVMAILGYIQPQIAYDLLKAIAGS